MTYAKTILRKVDNLVRDLKKKYTLYFSVEVFEEFKKRIGKRAPSVVLEEMMKHFNETAEGPRKG